MTTPDIRAIWAALSAIAGTVIESAGRDIRDSQVRLLETIRDEDRDAFIKEVRERFGLGEGWPFDPDGHFRYYASGNGNSQEIQRAAILECYSSRDRHLIEREIANAEQAAIATPTRLTQMLSAGYHVVFIPGVIPPSPIKHDEVSRMSAGAKATECATCGLTYGTHALDCPEAL